MTLPGTTSRTCAVWTMNRFTECLLQYVSYSSSRRNVFTMGGKVSLHFAQRVYNDIAFETKSMNMHTFCSLCFTFTGQNNNRQQDILLFDIVTSYMNNT